MSSGEHGVSSIQPFKSESECEAYAAWLLKGWDKMSEPVANQLQQPKIINYLTKHDGEWVAQISCVEPEKPHWKPLLP